MSVRSDGNISYPVLGVISVAGLTPTEMEAKIQGALAAKIYQRGLTDGRQDEIVINPNEVTATVVAYRPIYVDGEVMKPGEYTYRPSMTVLQAVSVAGGYSLLRARLADPFLALLDARSEFEATKTELLKEQARIWRARVELSGSHAPPKEGIAGLEESAIGAQILRIETDRLAVRTADLEREKAYFNAAIKHSDEQIGVLTRQRDEEEEGLKADLEELRKSQALYGNGTLTSMRVTDARRAVMLSATRKLQTSAQLLQIMRQGDEFKRMLQAVDDKRRMENLRELQDAIAHAAGLRAKLDGLSQKLKYMLAKADSGLADDNAIKLSIVRQDANGVQSFVAAEGTEILPGDVVEVTFKKSPMGRDKGGPRVAPPGAPS